MSPRTRRRTARSRCCSRTSSTQPPTTSNSVTTPGWSYWTGLVEAGVRCVTLSYSFWDWHGQNFKNARRNLPDFDRAMSALVTDLYERGLDRDVTVIAWGEFGRTPRINKKAGRDHWPLVSCALMSGGGLRTGQVIGSTTRDGGEAKDRPVHFQEVFASLYRAAGIDVDIAQVVDLSGRPRFLIEPGYAPIRELF